MAFIEHLRPNGMRLVAVRRIDPDEIRGLGVFLYEAYFVHGEDGLFSTPFGRRGDPIFVDSKCGRDRDRWRNDICGGVEPDIDADGISGLYTLMWYLANGPSSDMQQNIDMFKRRFQV